MFNHSSDIVELFLTPAKSDAIIFWVVSTLLLTKAIWSRYLPINDHIPESFWHIVPQHHNNGKADVAELVQSRNIRDAFTIGNLDVVIFWGSQSGRAELVARRLSKTLADKFSLSILAADLADFDHKHLAELDPSHLCGFVLSTYGDGDPPDNATEFWNTLYTLHVARTDLKNLRYVLFGLGNSQYRQFNHIAEQTDRVLQALGAVRYGEAGCGDDSNSRTESDFMLWRGSLEKTLMREFNFTEHTIPYQPSLKIQENTNLSVSQIFHGHPLPAIADRGQRPQPLEIRTIRKLWETAERLCLHIDVDLGVDRSVKYKTGGHLAIWPSNPSHEVDRLIAALSLTGKEHVPITIEAAKQPGQMPISIPTPTTIHALFRYYLEICALLSAETVADLQEFTESDAVKAELRRISSSADDFQSEIVVPHATLADVLENTCAKGVGVWNIPLSFILERTKPMKPRLYSISSSTIVHPRTVSITAVVTKTPACPPRSPHRYNGCYGLTTAYLRALESAINDTKRSVMTSEVQPSETMPFDLHGPGAVLAGKSMFGIVRQSSFKLPNKASTPIIMIGAGTGIAPFRGFVQERVKRKELGQEIGETILLMGFRNSTVDFIYRNEWKEWREILTPAIFKYKVAFSRDDECEKLHVQDLLIQSGREIFRLLNGDVPCQVYICGAAAMARNVMTTLATLKMTFCNVGEVEALAWVKKMQQSKRILEDVWG